MLCRLFFQDLTSWIVKYPKRKKVNGFPISPSFIVCRFERQFRGGKVVVNAKVFQVPILFGIREALKLQCECLVYGRVHFRYR